MLEKIFTKIFCYKKFNIPKVHPTLYPSNYTKSFKMFNKFTLNASLNLADIILYRNGLMQVETKNKTPDTVFTLNETFSLSALCSMYVNRSR